MLKAAEEATGLELLPSESRGKSGLALGLVWKILETAVGPHRGEEARPIKIEVVSGSRWPHQETALLWGSTEMALGSRADMKRIQPTLETLAFGWPAGRKLHQLQRAWWELQSMVKEITSVIKGVTNEELKTGTCPECSTAA